MYLSIYIVPDLALHISLSIYLSRLYLPPLGFGALPDSCSLLCSLYISISISIDASINPST